MSRLAVWTAVGVLGAGCAMLYTSLLMPPPGHIDNSVLVAFGEICTFSGTVLGIRNARKNRGKTDKI